MIAYFSRTVFICALFFGLISSFLIADTSKAATDKVVLEKLKNFDDKIMIVGNEVLAASRENFMMMDFIFENKTSKWIQVKKVSLTFGSTELDKNIEFLVGERLRTWLESSKLMGPSDTGDAVAAFLSVVGAASTIAGVSSRTSSARNAGLAGAALSLTAASAFSSKTRADEKLLSKMVPDDHLLAGGIVIPPKMKMKRWVAIYSEKPLDIPVVQKVKLNLEYADKLSKDFGVKLRSMHGVKRSSFQRDHSEVRKKTKKSTEF